MQATASGAQRGHRLSARGAALAVPSPAPAPPSGPFSVRLARSALFEGPVSGVVSLALTDRGGRLAWRPGEGPRWRRRRGPPTALGRCPRASTSPPTRLSPPHAATWAAWQRSTTTSLPGEAKVLRGLHRGDGGAGASGDSNSGGAGAESLVPLPRRPPQLLSRVAYRSAHLHCTFTPPSLLRLHTFACRLHPTLLFSVALSSAASLLALSLSHSTFLSSLSCPPLPLPPWLLSVRRSTRRRTTPTS